jgi:hypothetical protein
MRRGGCEAQFDRSDGRHHGLDVVGGTPDSPTHAAHGRKWSADRPADRHPHRVFVTAMISTTATATTASASALRYVESDITREYTPANG